MTLVLGCITPNFAIQVSDRRLTWLDASRRGTIADDGRNKVVLFCNRIAFGYTGLAQIGTAHTDEWLLNTIATARPANEHTIFPLIAKRAEMDLAAQRIPAADRRHAFFGTGWATFASDSDTEPYFVYISNFHDRQLKQLPVASDKFEIIVQRLRDLPFKFARVGQPLSAGDVTHLKNAARPARKHSAGAAGYVDILASIIRRVAKNAPTVGSNLLATVIPREAVGKGGFVTPLNRKLAPGRVTCIYLPADGNRGVAYGPHYTCGGMLAKDMLAASEVGPVDEGEVPLWFLGSLVLSISQPSASNTARQSLLETLFPDLKVRILAGPQSVPGSLGPMLLAVQDHPALIQIARDARFAVLTGPLAEPMERIDPDKLARVLAWLANQGIDQKALDGVASLWKDQTNAAVAYNIRGMIREHFVG